MIAFWCSLPFVGFEKSTISVGFEKVGAWLPGFPTAFVQSRRRQVCLNQLSRVNLPLRHGCKTVGPWPNASWKSSERWAPAQMEVGDTTSSNQNI